MQTLTLNGRIILASCLIVNDKRELLLLYRPEHEHYETPGGHVDKEDCKNPTKPTLEDFARAAIREGHEELGPVEFSQPTLFAEVHFNTPKGIPATVYKFLTKITQGTPKIAEPELFTKLEYVPITELHKKSLAPDFTHFLKKLQDSYK